MQTDLQDIPQAASQSKDSRIIYQAMVYSRGLD